MKAAAERRAGLRPYESAASEAQAAKAKQTFLLKRLARELKKAETGLRPRVVTKKGPRHGETQWVKDKITDAAKEKYFEWRRQKLNGDWLDDGDWHEMMTAARAINDPALSILMKS